MKLKHYLIATEQNNYRPWITTPSALACFCLLTWGLRIFLPTSFLFAAPGIDAYDVMARINTERTNRFLPALVTKQMLINAATIKSNDMLTRSYFAHVNPDGQYVWPTIEAQGYTPYKTLGENLAMDFTEAEAMVSAWMNSPTHRANIINEKFADQGLAAIYGLFEPGHNSIVTTSLFGTLLNPPPPPQPQPNPTPTPNPSATKPPPPSKPVPPPAPKPPPPPPAQAPAPDPTPPPTGGPTPNTTQESIVSISENINVVTELTQDKTLVRINVDVSGEPKHVTASIRDQKVVLKEAEVAGQYTGELVFNSSEDLSNEKLLVQVEDIRGAVISRNLSLENILGPNNNQLSPTNVNSEAELSRTMKLILAVFAASFLFFLALDSFLIFRAKIQRVGPSSGSHSILFMLIAIINLISALS